MTFNFERFFPFDTIREQQRDAINFALDAFLNQGKRFVILEMGPGCGKSATGLTIARYMAANHKPFVSDSEDEYDGGAYVLTTQKILQEQYVNDFGPSKKDLLRSIKSSSNYRCNFYRDQNCGESRRLLNKLGKQAQGTDFYRCCMYGCKYKLDKQEFVESPISITNFSYFLAETTYAGTLKPRELLIIDECHNIEVELGKFVNVVFSERFAKDVLQCKAPMLRGTPERQIQQVFSWIKKTYKPALAKRIAELEKVLKEQFNSGSMTFSVYSKQYEMLDKHICKVNRFISEFNSDNWIMNIIKPPEGKRAKRKFEFKPIDVSSFGNDMLYGFGERVLLLSATILDKDVFCRSIGIDPSQASFLRIPSPFPVENRPIHILSVGKMSMNHIDSTLPKSVEVIKMILEQHPDDKGIIHAVNYKVAKYVHDNVGSDRLLIHNSDNRDRILQRHIMSSEPTVLISPSMMEGVDLADDNSRFQILCKVPFPYLGDAAIKRRMKNDDRWYGYQTVKSVVQALGRSIRNETDHAVSYVLDSDWSRFFNTHKGMFPQEFIEAIQ